MSTHRQALVVSTLAGSAVWVADGLCRPAGGGCAGSTGAVLCEPSCWYLCGPAGGCCVNRQVVLIESAGGCCVNWQAVLCE